MTEEQAETGKTCPECAETVKAAALVCRFCGYRFDGAARPEARESGPTAVVAAAGRAGEVGALLDAARTQLSSGDVLGVFKTLERARSAAVKRASLEDLRAVQAVGQEASSRFAESGRGAAKASHDLLYAVKQNIAFQERVAASRSGISQSASIAATKLSPGESPPGPGRSGWGKPLAIFGGGVGFLILVLVIVALAENGKSKPTSAAAPGTTSKSASAPADTPEQHARAYIVKHGGDAIYVEANVAKVQVAVQSAINSQTQASLNQIALAAQTAHDNIDNIRTDFATATDPGALGNAELNVFAGANDLKNAMGALVAYTGTPNPATLAHFNSQYATARAEWNSGVRALWRTARRPNPPTV